MSAIWDLSCVNGTRIWASVEKVKRATWSSGLRADRAMLAAWRRGTRNGPMESLRSRTSATSRGSSSRLKISIFCWVPSSRSSKSPCLRSTMICPALFLTVASTRTRFTLTRITFGGGSWGNRAVGNRAEQVNSRQRIFFERCVIRSWFRHIQSHYKLLDGGCGRESSRGAPLKQKAKVEAYQLAHGEPVVSFQPSFSFTSK